MMGDDFRAVVSPAPSRQGLVVSEIDIYLDAKLNITFQQFQNRLGDWKLIRSSKTSTVRFDIPNVQSENRTETRQK